MTATLAVTRGDTNWSTRPHQKITVNEVSKSQRILKRAVQTPSQFAKNHHNLTITLIRAHAILRVCAPDWVGRRRALNVVDAVNGLGDQRDLLVGQPPDLDEAVLHLVGRGPWRSLVFILTGQAVRMLFPLQGDRVIDHDLRNPTKQETIRKKPTRWPKAL